MLYSNCCHAKVTIEEDDDLGGQCTMYYVCTSCNNPCDTIALTTLDSGVSECCHAKMQDSYNGEDGYWTTSCTQCHQYCRAANLETNVKVDKKLLAEGYAELTKKVPLNEKWLYDNAKAFAKVNQGLKEAAEICTPELTFDSVISIKRYWNSELFNAKMELDWLGVLWTRITHWYIETENTITRFIERGKRGWSRVDVWDLDRYLLDVLIETTERLNATTIRDDEKFKKDLHDISNTLKSVRGMYSCFMGKEASKQCQKQINYAFKLISKHFMKLWD